MGPLLGFRETSPRCASHAGRGKRPATIATRDAGELARSDHFLIYDGALDTIMPGTRDVSGHPTSATGQRREEDDER